MGFVVKRTSDRADALKILQNLSKWGGLSGLDAVQILLEEQAKRDERLRHTYDGVPDYWTANDLEELGVHHKALMPLKEAHVLLHVGGSAHISAMKLNPLLSMDLRRSIKDTRALMDSVLVEEMKESRRREASWNKDVSPEWGSW